MTPKTPHTPTIESLCADQADARRDAASMESALNALATWVREGRGMDAYKSRSRVYDRLSSAGDLLLALRQAEHTLERIAFSDVTDDSARVYREASFCLQDHVRPAIQRATEGSAE